MPTMFNVLELIVSILKIAVSRPHRFYMNLETKSFRLCLASGEAEPNSEVDSTDQYMRIGIVIAIAIIAAIILL